MIRQGGKGDTFYIISRGEVKVTQISVSPTDPSIRMEEEIRRLGRGDYFGEQALMHEDVRTANVVALEGGVECLVVDREYARIVDNILTCRTF